MNFKAWVYDTQDGKPMETTPRCIFCNENGKPERIQAHNGMNYREFHLWDDSKPSKWNEFSDKVHENNNP